MKQSETSKKLNLFNLILLVIVSFLVVSDLFLHQGRHITFDGHIHMTTMAQFAAAIKDGEFPVTWSNNFANYGLPLPLFAHQLPAYLGAMLILAGFSVVGAYNMLMFFGVLTSNLLFYSFVNKIASHKIALTSTILMTFFPYRIINIYIRGGLPEILATAIFPLLLISIYKINIERKKQGFVWLILSISLLFLCHPMMLFLFLFPLSVYFLITVPRSKLKQNIVKTTVSIALGIGITAFYFIPLLLEMKYFYQGNIKSSLVSGAFLSMQNFIEKGWFYFYTHPGPRGNYIKFGVIELALLVLIVVSMIAKILIKRKMTRKYINSQELLISWVAITLASIFMMLSFSEIVYKFIPGLNQLQYPWRFLSIIQFSLPLSLVYLVKDFKSRFLDHLLFGLIIILVLARTPQLYGKNFVYYPEKDFYFTRSNLHSSNLNTIWSGNSEDYPVKNKQTEIISGDGLITPNKLRNSYRNYTIEANSLLRLVDYTFYFPGWTVVADGHPVEIEFQDPKYRGLITYNLSEGVHDVEIKYRSTKVRSFASVVSIFSLSIFLLYFVIDKTKLRIKS